MDTDIEILIYVAKMSLLIGAASIGIFLCAAMLKIGQSLHKNRHIQFSEDDYRMGMTYDRKNNRIIPVRLLKKSAVARKILS